MLKAGYLEDWEYHDTLSGAPQGGVVSPILSNIYLHKLDEFVETGTDPAVHPGNTAGDATPNTGRMNARMRRARAARGPGTRPGTCARQTAPPAPRRPDGPRLPAAAVHQVRRRSPPGIHRAEGRSRGRSRPAGAVPAGDLGLELQPEQDPDHPRPHPGGAVPRLRDHRPALQHEDSPTAAGRSTGGSRCGCRWT